MHRDRRESWHDQPISDLTAQLCTDVQQGLSSHEAAQRLQQGGPNELRTGRAVSPLALLAGQFGNLVIWVLIGAALISVALGEVVDGVAILAIVVLNWGVSSIGWMIRCWRSACPVLPSMPASRW